MTFNPEGASDPVDDEKASQRAVCEGQIVHLGSIHSVKGRTVDAMLVVESEIFRGMGANERAMDMATVLPHAFGLENLDFNTRPVDLAAATNVFVGTTRPKHFLGVAVRKSVATAELIAAAQAQGWIVAVLNPQSGSQSTGMEG